MSRLTGCARNRRNQPPGHLNEALPAVHHSRGDGLTEEIITHLSGLQALQIISRSSAIALENSQKGVRTIERELNVGYLMEGSVRRGGQPAGVASQLLVSNVVPLGLVEGPSHRHRTRSPPVAEAPIVPTKRCCARGPNCRSPDTNWCTCEPRLKRPFPRSCRESSGYR